MAYQSATGELNYTYDAGGGLQFSQVLTGRAGGFLAFLGVDFRLGPTGLELVIEGDYSSAGVHTLGTKFGFRF
jgi:hypothetical protein